MRLINVAEGPKKKKPNGGYVKTAECRRTHAQVRETDEEFKKSLEQITNTLIGKPEPGSLERKNGMVQDIRDIKDKMKSKWSAKDKVALVTTFIVSATAIIIAILK